MRSDVDAFPHSVHQRIACDHFSGVFDKMHQNIEGLGLERDGTTLALKAARVEVEPEVVERKDPS